MSTIVAFYGSPRKKGFCAKLMERVIEGAKSAGAEVKSYDLNADGVKGCQSCFYCRKNDGCAKKDTLQPMYDDIKAADGIVAGFPNYFGDISGQSKLWIDRLYPMIDASFAPRHPGKKIVTVFAQANDDKDMYTANIDATNAIFKMFAWDVAASLLMYGTGAPDYDIPKELSDAAFEAGKQLVK